MAPSAVNDTIRQIMADLRSWYESAQFVDLGHVPTRTGNTTFTIATDVTATYTAGRRLKATDSSTVYATIASSSYSAPNTTVTVVNGTGNLTASLTAVAVGIITPTNNANSVAQAAGTTTNDSASAGNLGEFISSNVGTGSAVSLSNGTTANITSISLTAGDWDVYGNVGFLPAAGTLASLYQGAISTTSATSPTVPGAGGMFTSQHSFGAGTTQLFPVGTTRLSLASTTTVYLVAVSNFTTSTMTAYGFIGARRAR